ncbi:hypothetical protein GCM10009096_28810 [Parasphingorhabdus litoris]|uniref:Transposase n=1 Tax=Parasphingorhabdus litoris TaxID=394733 RepID=A0ABN1AV19_9SPHN
MDRLGHNGVVEREIECTDDWHAIDEEGTIARDNHMFASVDLSG